MNCYVIKYQGTFGFIKPWTAVRDEETYSQQFLTPSIVEGIEKKLFPELLNEDFGIHKIKAHRLNYKQISRQQEVTQTRGWNTKGKGKNKEYSRPNSIIIRGVLVAPKLFLVFSNKEDAEKAFKQHVCLSRNEDLLFPKSLEETTFEEFNSNTEKYNGFELKFEESENSFLVGYNRYNEFSQMFGWLKVVGEPVESVF